MVRNSLFLLFILFTTSASVLAQLKTGSIKMEITDFESPDMEGDMGVQIESMMSSMKMTMHFKPDYQVTEINMMGMMTMKQHYKDNVMTQYMDVMGQKIIMKTPMNNQLEELKKLGVDIENMSEVYDISYDRTDTQEILGYECYRANISMDLGALSGGENIPQGMQDMTMVMYLTDEIEMNQFSMQGVPGLEMKGAPLSFTIDMGVMKMTYTAIEFDDSPDPSVFEKPKGEYKEMSMEDLQKMGLGSGGMGF